MTQVGEGPGAGHPASAATAFGAPMVGEILAERYQLDQHINNDSAGRQIWRGMDVILRRPVAVVMRYPGGPAATQMLQSAVEVSRIVHPNLAGVYDAIDEGTRAYVVREWIDGASLREHVAVGPFDAERATVVAHATAAAVTAVHSTGMPHGNIHPSTVLIGSDGRVVLADARADGAVAPEKDVRAVGAILYFALTGYWPHAEAGPTALPDAPRDPAGGLTSPRQVRADVPDHLDALAMDLLDPRLEPPPADVLTSELARLDSGPEEHYYPDSGHYVESGPAHLTETPFLVGGGSDRPASPKRSAGKIAIGVGTLLVIGIVGLLIGVNALTSSGSGDDTQGQGGGPTEEPGDPSTAPGGAGQPTPIPLTAGQIRVVDPPDGDRAEVADVELTIDGDVNTGWRTQSYNQPEFGHIKPGMGILIDLGEARQLATVEVDLSASGATAELRVGDSDPGNSTEGDDQITKTYQTIGEPLGRWDGTTMVFSGFEPDATYQYLLVWLTELPPDPDNSGKFRIGVQEITVLGP